MTLDSLQERLDAAQERVRILENIMDNLPSMIGYWDHNLVNRYSNSAYQEYFSKTRSEIEGRHIKDLLGAELFGKNLPYMELALQGVRQTFERDIPMPNGGVKNTHAHYIPEIRNGVVKGFFVLVVDVTPLKQAAREREQVALRLSESNKMVSLGEMAGGVAHEINTPLAVISMNSGMIEAMLTADEVDKEKLQTSILNINKTVSRISKVVRGLLYFSKDRRNEVSMPTSVQSILDETLPFCLERFRNHEITLEYPENIKLEIDCRAVEISQVLVNLLNNAFDVMKQQMEKWVRIEVGEKEGFVEIAVTDSGPGIAPTLREKVMQPFFTTKEIGKGTGLGLSISKGIVENHGGMLFLDAGSTHTKFIIRLPKRQ